MRGWMLIGLIAVFLVALPLWAVTQNPAGELGWLNPVGKIVLSFDLVLVVGATGLFGYICLRAQARKWGSGLLAIAIISVLGIYFIWFGHLPFLP